MTDTQKTTETPTLAKGAPLTAATWLDFKKRLQHHCVGAGVSDHATADAVFLVQARRVITGIDPEFTENLIAVDLTDSETTWASPAKFWEDANPRIRAHLSEEASNQGEENFLDLPAFEQWHLIGELEDVRVTGTTEEWKTINFHFTKEAADAFIKRKQHDYPDGLRVYVDAQLYCWEFNTLKNAILNGNLVFKE